MAILGIPNELLLEIGEYLPIGDLSHFLLTCWRLKILLTPRLYKLGLRDLYSVTALQWAAWNGYAYLAKEAILGGAEIEKLFSHDPFWTPLHTATYFGHDAVTSILIEHGANVAAIDSNQQTPLHLAAKSGHSTVTSILISHGAHMTDVDNNQQTPLHLAAKSGCTAIVSTLVEQGANTAAIDLNQRTPLHLAAYNGHSAAISILVKYGANITAIDMDQRTPLHLAVRSKVEAAIRVLLDLGADMLCLDYLKEPPVHYAATYGSIGCMKAFIDAGFDINYREPLRNRTVLHDAADSDKIDILEYLLGQEGLETVVNAQEIDGSTALHLAVCSDFAVESVRLLLQHGADMGVVCNKGYTPVHLAIKVGDLYCLRAFIDAGFDTNIRGGIGKSSGSTILHEAIYVAGLEGINMIEYLLEQEGGKDIINAQDDCGSTPLHLAAGLGQPISLLYPVCGETQDKVTQGRAKVKLLVQNGTDLKIKDNMGNTPAHVAAYRGDIGRMKPFVDCGLDFNSRGLSNRTFLHAAVFGGRKMLEYLLSQKGIKMIINARDLQGLTPLQLATLQSFEKEELVRLLLHGGANPAEEDDYRDQPISDCGVQDEDGSARKILETLALRFGEKGVIEYMNYYFGKS